MRCDLILKTDNIYDAASNLIQVTTRERFHDATGTGELTSPGGAQPKARVSYTAAYPDALGRTRAVAGYGTYGGSSFTRPSTIPARADTVLVSSTDYNTRGEPFQTTDPKGSVTLRGFDDAGRVFQKVEDRYGVVRTTDFTYTADNQLATLTAVNGVTGNQTTTWTYGTTLSDSDVASNDLLRFEQYPDGSSSDRVEYKYNRLGEVKEIKPQNGTIRLLKYDKLGRLEHDCANTLGSNVDGAVRRLTRAYEARGLLEKLTSYDNATPGSGSIVNEVKYEYNGFMLLTKESQSHQGAVTSSTPKAQYGYSDGSSNHARRISCTSPDGTVLEYDYGSPAHADDALNRVEHLKCGTGMAVEYSYLGVDQMVICSYWCEPSVELTYFTQGQTGEAGDQYTGLDRFGRVIDQCWCKTTPAADKERVKYGFDRVSNRKWRQNTVADALGKKEDEFYTYNGLNQVKSLDRGKLKGDKSGIDGTPEWEEDWNYDATGNWRGETSGYVTKVSGSTTLDQNRTHNAANELATITNAGGGSQWPTPAYDALGSFITTPQPKALTSSFGLKWDAWNRMVEVSAGGNFVARWAYDGAHRRISQLNGEEFRHYFYSDQWQVLEERTGDNAYAERRFIWGMRGVDDLVCRDRQIAGTTERLYSLNDPANVTAIVDVVGAVQERYGYSGFGVPRYLDANFDSRSESSFDWETLFGGYRYDAKTGLYLPRHRILHARLGRWLSRDPIGYRAGTNLYGNVGNGPMNSVDPFGLAEPTPEIAAFIEKYAQEHGGEQPWVGWWDTHQNRAFPAGIAVMTRHGTVWCSIRIGQT